MIEATPCAGLKAADSKAMTES